MIDVRRPEPGALQPLPARVLGRPATADRHRARDRHDPAADRRRRARVGARRLDPGADPQPAPGPPRRPRADARLHLPRPLCRPAPLRPGRRDVPRQDRRALAGRRAVRRSPIHPYTEALLSAVPVRDAARRAARRRIVLRGRRRRARSRRRPRAASTPVAGTRPRSAARSSRRSSTTATAISPPATTR